MIVDTSALVAILWDESESPRFEAALDRAQRNAMSAATYIEFVTVIDRRAGAAAVAIVDEMIAEVGIDILPFTLEQMRWARHARLTYGVGRHPANLNFGDCFAYALAKATDEPLLFKGDDFSRTDLVAALAAGPCTVGQSEKFRTATGPAAMDDGLCCASLPR